MPSQAEVFAKLRLNVWRPFLMVIVSSINGKENIPVELSQFFCGRTNSSDIAGRACDVVAYPAQDVLGDNRLTLSE